MQQNASRRARWSLPALALLGAIIGHAGAQAQQPEDEQRRAAQAALIRQAQQRDIEQRRAVQEAVMARPVWTDEQLEVQVFQPDGSASGARRRLDSLLARQIANIDRACTLTDAQKQKLRLAGRGDIKRLFDRFEGIKRKSQAIEHPELNFQEIQQEMNALRMTQQGELFHEDSLLVKSLPNTLTGEQFARYGAMARERRAARHRAGIEQALAILQRGMVLSDAQRQALITLMRNETKLTRRSSPYDAYVLLLQLGHLPEEKLKRLFNDTQWQIVNEHLAQFQQLEPMLKQSGQWPDKDGGADSPDEWPAPLKK